MVIEDYLVVIIVFIYFGLFVELEKWFRSCGMEFEEVIKWWFEVVDWELSLSEWYCYIVVNWVFEDMVVEICGIL